MTAENEPRRDQSESQEQIPEHRETLATSLTDLIDEMDRAHFRRSLESRHLRRHLELETVELIARQKTS